MFHQPIQMKIMTLMNNPTVFHVLEMKATFILEPEPEFFLEEYLTLIQIRPHNLHALHVVKQKN